MLYSRIKTLEEEVRIIIAMSEEKKQDHKHRNNLVEGVSRAERMEAAAQKVAVAKRRQLSIHTQNLQRFKNSLKSSSRTMQRAGSRNAARCTDDSRYSSISGNIHSKREEAQEPGANPQQSPNNQRTNEVQQTRAEQKSQRKIRTHRRHDTGMLWKCDDAGCSEAYAKLVHLTNHYKEDNLSLGLKRPLICDKCASKFVQKEHTFEHFM